MKIINYIIIGLISSITNILPLSYQAHLTLYQHLFNTKIFDNPNLNSLFIIAPLLAITTFLIRHFPKISKNKKMFIHHLLLLSLTFIFNCFFIFLLRNYNLLSLKSIPFTFIISAILLILIRNKKYERNISHLTIKNYFLFFLASLLAKVFNFPIFLSNYFICYLNKLNKASSLKLSFIFTMPTLLIESLPGVTYLINAEEIIYLLISLFISTVISFFLIKYLKKLIKNNNFYKIAIYLIILAFFTIYWFR